MMNRSLGRGLISKQYLLLGQWTKKGYLTHPHLKFSARKRYACQGNLCLTELLLATHGSSERITSPQHLAVH